MSTFSWRTLLSEAWGGCLNGTARVRMLTILAAALVEGVIYTDTFSLHSASVEVVSLRVYLRLARVLRT